MRALVLAFSALLFLGPAAWSRVDPGVEDCSVGNGAEIAYYVEQGFLPADFSDHPCADRRSMFSGAQALNRSPGLDSMINELRPGDVVLVHGYDAFITPLDENTHWIHAGIVVSSAPMNLVEAWGPDRSNRSYVREVHVSEFIDGTPADGYRVIHPTDVGAYVQLAIGFARAQVGKPYDYTAGLMGERPGESWYCSNLVYDAYSWTTDLQPLRIRKDPRRDAKLAVIRDLLGAFKIKDRAVVGAWAQELTGSVFYRPPSEALYTEQQVIEDLLDKVLVTSPVFVALVRDPDGHEALLKILSLLMAAADHDQLTWQYVAGVIGRTFLELGPIRQAKLELKGLLGLLQVDWGQGFLAARDQENGAVVPGLVSPADIAAGDNADVVDFQSL